MDKLWETLSRTRFMNGIDPETIKIMMIFTIICLILMHNTKYINLSDKKTNGFWWLMHFMYWFIIGLLIPRRTNFIIQAVIIMISWEIIEKLRGVKDGWYIEENMKKVGDMASNLMGFFLARATVNSLNELIE